MLAVIAGAKSRSARQLAWKRGCALDVLRGDGVSPDEFVKEIKKRGGIEKIYQRSIDKSTDRPVPKSSSRSSAPKNPSSQQADNSATKTNNREILVGVYMNLSHRDAILDVPAGTRVKLSAIRIGQRKADLKIRAVKILKLGN